MRDRDVKRSWTMRITFFSSTVLAFYAGWDEILIEELAGAHSRSMNGGDLALSH